MTSQPDQPSVLTAGIDAREAIYAMRRLKSDPTPSNLTARDHDRRHPRSQWRQSAGLIVRRQARSAVEV